MFINVGCLELLSVRFCLDKMERGRRVEGGIGITMYPSF